MVYCGPQKLRGPPVFMTCVLYAPIGYRDYLSRLPEAAHLLLKKEFDSENDLHAHLKLRKEFDSKNDLCAITKSMGEADWDKETVFRPFLVQLPAKPRLLFY